MTDQRRRKVVGVHDAAESVFKPAGAVVAEQVTKPPVVPGARELVSIRLDQDVLAHFQGDGPGWQERLNQTLRKAVGL